MTLPQVLLWGAVGGVLPDAIRLVRSRYEGALPPYVRSLNFYVGLLLAMVLGAATAGLLGAASVKAALAYGFGSPELLTRLLASPGLEYDAARINAVRTFRAWWAI